MGALLGGLAGSAGSGTQPASPSGGGDLMGALLGGLTGGSGGGSQNLLGSLAQAFLGGSGMGKASHREQSTQVVVNSFLQALSSTASQR